MATLLSMATAASLVAGTAAASQPGFVGYGIAAYQPMCGWICREVISGAQLNCSTIAADSMDGMGGMTMTDTLMTEPACYAADTAFLQTLAFCMHQHCGSLPAAARESYWERQAVGTDPGQPAPKWTYSEALAAATADGAPTVIWSSGPLNNTSIINETVWQTDLDTEDTFWGQERQQEKYALVLLLSGFVIPIGFSLLRFLPFPAVWRALFNAWVIDPPAFGSKHDVPVAGGLLQVPRRGQALFIGYLVVINVVLSAVNYAWVADENWFPGDKWRWMVMLIANRLGLLSFANLPLLFLYAGRNNVLLWLTNWPHATFLLLHRWVAAIATLQAILHSILYLAAYLRSGTHNEEAQEPYWYWGIIATLGMTILFPASVQPLRQRFYEAFLAWHVAVSILVVAGCYWHIVFEFSHKWGYELWVVLAMVVWAFDRVVRAARLVRSGVHTAHVTALGPDYCKVVIPGLPLAAGGHAYLYFPTLTWRLWENHPFSVAAGLIPAVNHDEAAASAADAADAADAANTAAAEKGTHTPLADAGADEPKLPVEVARSHSDSSKADVASGAPAVRHRPLGPAAHSDFETGAVFYVRTRHGITEGLSAFAGGSLPVLVEAGYGARFSFVHAGAASHSSFPTVIGIAGGVGVTAVLPTLQAHAGCGRAHLYWGARAIAAALVDDVRASGTLSRVDHDIYLGERVPVRTVLHDELVGATGEVLVLVSGPEAMIDETRNSVGELVRTHTGLKVTLETESFSW